MSRFHSVCLKGVALRVFSLFLISNGFAQAKDAVINYHGEEFIELIGDWAFYWEELRDPSLSDLGNHATLHYCPSQWTDYDYQGEKLPSEGFVTYELIIVADKFYPNIAFEVHDFYTAYALYLNGTLIAKNGQVGTNKESAVPFWLSKTVQANLRAGNNKLTLHISNFHHNKAGFFKEIKMGTSEYLFQNRETSIVITSFVIGSLIVISVFFLGMYLFWMKDPATLYYSLFTLSYALRLSTYDLHLFIKYFPYFEWATYARLEYLFFFTSSVLVMVFFWELFKQDFSKKMIKGWIVLNLCYALITLFSSPAIYSIFMPYYIMSGGVSMVYVFYVVIRAMINKRQGANIAGMGSAIYVVGIAIAMFNFIGETTAGYMVVNGLFLASFTVLSFVLAQRFGLAFATVETLRIETLQQKNSISEKSEQLRKADELKSRWFVNVSHDLKTPLTLIQGPIQKILKEETIKEGGKEDLQIANRNVKQLSRLISQIMDVSKLENGKLEPVFQTTHIQSLMRETVALFESFAAINQVNLSLQLAGSNYLKVDEDLIRKVIINLVSNALKYTHQGGEVTVSLIAMSDRFAISVNDDGEGISEEDLPFIFDRYYQSNNSEKALQGGTGVGLSLSREIVEMHEGELSVESLEGRGSTFTFTIPRSFETEGESVETDIEGSSKIQIIEPIVEDTNKPLLLLVEDNADMRLYIKNIMKADYRVHEARDGIEALEMLSAALPAVIISDIMMPRMDGIKLAKEIKKHPNWKSIPFVSLTSLSSQGHKTLTLQIGIDDYICKPFDPEELKIRISNLIENFNNRKSLEKEAALTSYDEAMIEQLRRLVQKNMTSSLLSIGFLAGELNMSERKLQRDLKKSTGLTPVQFIREIRLQKALELLENQVYPTLSEVVHAIGFERTSYFTELFKKRFGKNPGGYLK